MSNRRVARLTDVFSISLDALTGHQPPEIPGLPTEIVQSLHALRTALDDVRRAFDAVEAAIAAARVRS